MITKIRNILPLALILLAPALRAQSVPLSLAWGLAEQAIRLGICETAVWHKVFKAHTLPMPKLRRVNARVVWVRV